MLLLAVSARVWRVSRKEERAEAVETSCRCRVWLLVTSSSTSGRLTCTTHILSFEVELLTRVFYGHCEPHWQSH